MPWVVVIAGSHGFLGSSLMDVGRQRNFDMRRIVLPRDMTEMSAAALARCMPAGQIGALVHASAPDIG